MLPVLNEIFSQSVEINRLLDLKIMLTEHPVSEFYD